jgi:hypothetical protein
VTTLDEEVREGSFPEDEHDPDSTAQARAQARASVAPPSSISRQLVTDSAQAVKRIARAAAAFPGRRGSLADSQPMTYRQARAYHHRCAGEFEAAVLRWPRLAWGYLHMGLVKWVCDSAEWVTESPARCAVAVAVYFVVRHWG